MGDSSPDTAINAYVEKIDSAALGFNAVPAATGRPGYHLGLMLRIYLYGYLNQIQSSRRLERECGRNLELIRLIGRLKPDFKTIADFRKDNGPAIGKVCQQFVALCRNINLLDGNLVAIDGSRFKAVNAKAKNYTRGKLRQKLSEIDKAIERYLSELDRADEAFEQTGTVLPEARMERTLRKLEHFQKEAAHDAMALDRIEAIADKGNYKSEEVLACEEAGMSPIASCSKSLHQIAIVQVCRRYSVRRFYKRGIYDRTILFFFA